MTLDSLNFYINRQVAKIKDRKVKKREREKENQGEALYVLLVLQRIMYSYCF